MNNPFFLKNLELSTVISDQCADPSYSLGLKGNIIQVLIAKFHLAAKKMMMKMRQYRKLQL